MVLSRSTEVADAQLEQRRFAKAPYSAPRGTFLAGLPGLRGGCRSGEEIHSSIWAAVSLARAF